jgi:hypothetical protein
MLFQVGLHLLDHVCVMPPVLFVTFVLSITILSNFDESNICVYCTIKFLYTLITFAPCARYIKDIQTRYTIYTRHTLDIYYIRKTYT